MTTRLMLVPSTHWDREWYKSEAEFSVHLLELFDLMLEGLESGELPNFHTDGQSVIVEDILRLRPELQERIRRQAAAGKLEIGPWYALTDMFMPDGESFLRNLHYGREIASALGSAPGVPYAPDAFGHTSELPAILGTAGFDAYFFCRGLGGQMKEARTEFIWRDAHDRYSVLGLAAIVDIFDPPHDVTGKWIAGAYGLGMVLPAEDGEFRQRLELMMEHLRAYSDLPVQLAMNGCDHLLPERDLARRLAVFNRSGAGFAAETSTLAAYVAEAYRRLRPETMPVVRGELTDGRFFWILTGTGSVRTELKIRNAAGQDWLEGFAEPALALAPPVMRGRYRPLLDQAWKWLLQNQTHDSLCGCSTDAVHREMLVRYDRLEASMYAVADRILRHRAGVDELRMVMPAAATEVVRAAVTTGCAEALTPGMWSFSVMYPADLKLEEFAMYDAAGNEWAYLLLPEAPESTTNGPFLPSGPDGRVCGRSRIFTAMPAPDGYGVKLLEFRRRNSTAPETSGADAFRVDVIAGKIVLDAPGCRIEDWLSLEDDPDRGDEYFYLPVAGAEMRRNDGWRVVARRSAGTLRQLEVATNLRLPAALGSTESVDNPVRLTLIWDVMGTVMASHWEVENRARDHRLRLRVRTPFAFASYCKQTQFQHLTVPVAPPERMAGWREYTEPIRKNFGFLSVAAPNRHFSILPEGLHEHTVDGQSFTLTLFRAVGNLGSSGAGPAIATRESQSLGLRGFRIGFDLAGDASAVNTVWRSRNRLFRSGEGVVLHPESTPSAAGGAEVLLDSAQLMVSAFYLEPELNCPVVRIFNPTGVHGHGRLSGAAVPARLRQVQYHRAQPSLVPGDVGTEIALAPGEIATFALES